MQLTHPRTWPARVVRRALGAGVALLLVVWLGPLPSWVGAFAFFFAVAVLSGSSGAREKDARRARDTEKRAYLADEERRHREARERRAAAERGQDDPDEPS